MHYQSTRGSAPVLGFEEVLLTGLARDGGLYLPSQWPGFSSSTWRGLAGADYRTLAQQMLTPFMAGSAVTDALPELLDLAYSSFHP